MPRKVRVREADRALKELRLAHHHLTEAGLLLEAAFDNGVMPKPAKKPVEPLHTPLKNTFMEWYSKEKGIEYIWSATDAMHVNLIIGKLRSLTRTSERHQDSILDEVVLNSWPVILGKLKSIDIWIYDNVSMQLINNKFNSIIAKISMPKGTDAELDDYKKKLADRLNTE